MADGGQVNWFLDAIDDPLLPDGIPDFTGGQFSNLRANLLQPNQSSLLGNADLDKLGKLRTRRGTILLGTGAPSGATGKIIQGLTSYQTADANYVVAAHDAKLWKYTDGAPGTWTQIALGGTADDEEILISRDGLINRPFTAGTPDIPEGYTAGTMVLEVDGITGRIEPGDKLYFKNNMRSAPYEYVVASTVPTTGTPITSITLEAPGLVFDVRDNWGFTVLRPAQVNHPTPGTRYAAGTTTIEISGYTDAVNNGEKFVIKSENINHNITGHSETGANTTSLTFTPGLQTDWAAGSATVPVVFAQGNDQLFFSDGSGAIYGWNGTNLMKIGSYSLLDAVGGSVHGQARTTPPQDVTILVWFQNRLIASGIADEPDAIYFSDFFDASAWDADYQMVRVGGGESDPITGLLAWTDLNLLVFKKNSIYIINCDPSQNMDPNDPTLLVASFAVKQLHKKIGCPAPLTAVQVGGGSTTPGSDVFFVDGDKKVHSIRRVMAAETQQEVGTAMSLPIQDVMDTINIDHIDRACATYHNEHYILAIPSTRGRLGGTYPNAVVAYNLLTQSWCGVWGGWVPTCFAMRTDLGSYSKMIFGQSDVDYAEQGAGYVLQWLDDQSLDEETEDSYTDWGLVIPTQILTRAITGGDYYSFKTGLSVEFEFDESMSEAVLVKVILDKVTQSKSIAWREETGQSTFSSLSEPRLRLPFTLTAAPNAVRLPASPGLLRKAFDLQRYGTWRELQFFITTASGKLIRSIRVTYFMDTVRLQTIPDTGIFGAAGDILIPGTPGP